jgi:hypothetical protein
MSGSEIQVLVREMDIVEGAKTWGAPQIIEKCINLDTKIIIQNLNNFSSEISKVLPEVKSNPGFSLHSLEFTVELTGKGEIRLVASASAELKSGILDGASSNRNWLRRIR